MRIAIVGAGMAGLSCATRLAGTGHVVTLFDKGRGAGGRMATRRIATPLGEASFDHGAQYLTARDPGFAAQVERWGRDGVVAPWLAAGDDAWVGVPGMNAPAKALAAGLDIRQPALIDVLHLDRDGWRLNGGAIQAGPFQAVVVAVPAEQVGTLVGPWDAVLAAEAAATPAAPCWTAMLVFEKRLPTVADILTDRGPVVWAARNSAKPGRGGPEAWVVQATSEWSRRHLEDLPDTVGPRLAVALAEAVGAALPPLVHVAAHRWRYARSGRLGREVLWNRDLRLGVCGDWLLGPRVECAWMSGDGLGRRIAGLPVLPGGD